MVLTIIAVSADFELKRLLGNVINSVVLKNKALLYLTSVFSYNRDFTAGATRPRKILNLFACIVILFLEIWPSHVIFSK